MKKIKHLTLGYMMSPILVALLFIMNIQPAHSQVKFQKSYGSAGTDFAKDIIEAHDGGYIAIGSTGSFGAGANDMYQFKIDSLGIIEWSKTYGGPETESGQSICKTYDGGYISVGTTISWGVGSNDFYLVKTDAEGDLLWSKTYGGTKADLGYCVIQTADSGFAASGFTRELGGYDFYIVKTDALGNFEWDGIYGGTGTEACSEIIQTSDGGFLGIGSTDSFGAGMNDIFAVKTDNLGNIVWSKSYGSSSNDNGYTCIETPDSCFILSGRTQSFGASSSDIYIVKIDTSGSVIWSKMYGGVNGEGAYGIDICFDGNIVLSGSTGSGPQLSGDAFIIKIDTAGNILWSKDYDALGTNGLEVIRQASDSGFVGIGSTANAFQNSQSFNVIKTDKDGNLGCNEYILTLVTAEPATQVNSGGTYNTIGTYDVAATIVGYPTTLDSTQCDYCLEPVADFLFINSNLQVSFSDMSIMTETWFWDFGDGNTETSQNPEHTYSSEGIYEVCLIVSNYCSADSLCDTVTISCDSAYLSQIAESICDGDSIIIGGGWQTVAGLYTDSLIAVNGCDSIIQTNLTVNEIHNSLSVFEICEGDSILISSEWQTTSAIYTDSLLTIHGCDSIIQTDLVVNESYIISSEAEICEGDSILIASEWQTTSAIYTDSLLTINGCDSITLIDLVFTEKYIISSEAEICDGDSILIAGEWQTTLGIYTDSLLSIHGCDSIIQIDLTVIQIDTSVTVNDDILSAISGYDSYEWINCTSGLTITGEETPDFLADISDAYAVVISNNECIDTSGCHLVIIDGIVKNDFGPDLRVMPNPTSSFLTIELGSLANKTELALYTMQGKLVFQDQLLNLETFKVDLSGLPVGLYTLNLVADGRSVSIKVILEK